MSKYKLNVLDIETFGKDRLYPYCVCISYRNKKIVFYGLKCIEKMLEYMFINCDDKTIFFAHNLTFDGLLILNSLKKNIIIKSDGTLLKNCEIYSLCLYNGFKSIFLRCSAKILPLPLKDIADKLNLPKKLSIDHNNICIENYNDKELKDRVIEYCKRDVYITQEFMIKINEEINNFYPGWWLWIYTISGLALKLFDKNFNKYVKLKDNLDMDGLIRPSYYGGRCEVFGNPRENEKIYHYDFSSMYTNMLKEEFPYDEYEIVEEPSNIDKIGFYFVKVNSQIESIPILPYRCKKTEKLIFPNGNFTGLYWYEELQLFIQNGGVIVKIYYAVVFDKRDYIFKNFSEFCLNNRAKSNLNNILWKIIPNSFIGRLGLKPKNEETIIIKSSEYRPWEYDVINDKKINDQFLVRIKKNDDKYKLSNNVIYPAIITSKARILWWRTADNIIKKGGRVLYCDTDSIFVAFKRNIIGENHGNLTWVDNGKDTVIDKACFAGNKAYAIKIKEKSIIKIKGTKKNDINFEEFENRFYNSKNIKIKYEFFNKKFMDIKIEEIIKNISFSEYDKRSFSECKKETSPIIINEDTLYNE